MQSKSYRRLSEVAPGVLALECADSAQETTQWAILEMSFSSQKDYPWWEFPLKVVLIHEQSGTKIVVEGFWDGKNAYRIRFTLPLPGKWSWHTSSPDPGLDSKSGMLTAVKPTKQQIDMNPNYRGHLRISSNGRHFEYADGTPFFLLADTLWAGNTARCGLGEKEDGPFYTYLDDRESKQFTTCLMQFLYGFGDNPIGFAGDRNEGGHTFQDGNIEQMNPPYFDALDARLDTLWRRGFVAATPQTWFGKLQKERSCFFTVEWAKRISAYLMVRFGAYNVLWSLSGEYQYAFRDCGWTTDDFSKLGRAVQSHNSYHHPVSIHPSGATHWDPPHGVQSSKPYHNSGWLDHNWLQTGQSIDRMYNIATRTQENRALEPVRPVFCSEAYYESPLEIDPEGSYHSRWQVWVAFLSGAAGYGHGTRGIWQCYDPDDVEGETGNPPRDFPRHWLKLMSLKGSSKLQHAKRTLLECDWHRLEPHPEWLTLDGSANWSPTGTDSTPPHCAAIPGKHYIIYIPRGNASRTISITNLDDGCYSAKWVDPRDGGELSIEGPPCKVNQWELPGRPDPDEDWTLVISQRSR
jgi:hypothetical protein